MNGIITIENTELQIREYNGQRVVTFKDIDDVHGRVNGTARNAFKRNKKHFIINEDYFVCETYEAKERFGITAPRGLILFTENGYLMLVKPFTDDLSWDVQRRLVNSYFKVKDKPPHTTALSTAVEPPKVPLRVSWYQDNLEDIKTLAKRHKVSEKRVLHWVLEHLNKKYNLSAARAIYEKEMGCAPDYATDIIGYFPELKKMADDYLDTELMKSVGMDW